MRYKEIFCVIRNDLIIGRCQRSTLDNKYARPVRAPGFYPIRRNKEQTVKSEKIPKSLLVERMGDPCS